MSFGRWLQRVKALYSLERRARLQPRETVLIHAAAGGVGQAAVQLAQRAGARVVATASPGKWSVLEAQGVRHVFNSRDTDFAERVLELTEGRGVDVVLNSLAGDIIPASLKALAQGGRFVDIGKIGVWSDEQMQTERADVVYSTFDMADLLDADPGLHRELLDDLGAGFADGSLVAPPVRAWPLQDAVAAFTHLAQAKNVGKLVLAMPTPAVRDDRSYLVTGGLGALGLLAADWLVEQGARHLVLCGRSAPSERARERIAALETAGAQVTVAAVDVSDRDQVRALLDGITPPLAGVQHAAGVLDDGVLMNMDWERFATVFAPKVDGARHLHELTRDRPLDHFVCYSSMASMVGSNGQGNYAAANAVLDALAHQRRSEGLPATSINWGPWAGGGMAASTEARNEARFAELGLRSIQPEQGLGFLERALAEPTFGQLGALPVTWSRYLARYPDGPPPYLAGLASTLVESGGAVRDDILEQLQGVDFEQARTLLSGFLCRQLASVMGFATADDVDTRQEFTDMGIDSLLAVDLRNRLESNLAITLPATLVFDHPNLESLIEALALMMTTADVDDALLDEIEGLSEEEAERLLAAEDGDEDDR